MPRLQRKAFKAAAKKQGLTGKKMRKSFAGETRKLNGGKSRAGRLWRGGAKMAAGMIPGIGGALAGVLTDTIQEKGIDPNTLPMFQKDDAQPNMPSFGEAIVKQAMQTGQPVIGTKPETKIESDVPPQAFQRNNAGGGGGQSMAEDAEEQQPVRQGNSYAPAKPEAPKKDNKIIYIVVGSLFLLLIIFLIIKVTKGKK